MRAFQLPVLILATVCLTACPRDYSVDDVTDEDGPQPVGMWRLQAEVQTEQGLLPLSIQWHLCEDGLLTGYEWLDEWVFVDLGHWSMTDAGDVAVEYETMDVDTEEIYGPSTGELSWVDDELCCFGEVPLVLAADPLTDELCPE
jgi:hypothetical protein